MSQAPLGLRGAPSQLGIGVYNDAMPYPAFWCLRRLQFHWGSLNLPSLASQLIFCALTVKGLRKAFARKRPQNLTKHPPETMSSWMEDIQVNVILLSDFRLPPLGCPLSLLYYSPFFSFPMPFKGKMLCTDSSDFDWSIPTTPLEPPLACLDHIWGLDELSGALCAVNKPGWQSGEHVPVKRTWERSGLQYRPQLEHQKDSASPRNADSQWRDACISHPGQPCVTKIISTSVQEGYLGAKISAPDSMLRTQSAVLLSLNCNSASFDCTQTHHGSGVPVKTRSRPDQDVACNSGTASLIQTPRKCVCRRTLFAKHYVAALTGFLRHTTGISVPLSASPSRPDQLQCSVPFRMMA